MIIYKKAIFSGNFTELLEYENGLKINFKVENIKKRTKKGSVKKIRPDNYIRAKNTIKRLAWANQNSFKTFITLTFAENVTDINLANKQLNLFQKRIKRAFPDVQYLGVMEFQKRGSIHYHFLFSHYVSADLLADYWGQGFVKIQKIKNKKNLGQYIVKYMTKELFNDNRYFMKRKFFYSRNLKKPIIITCQKLIDKIFNLNYNEIKLNKLFSTNFNIDYIGKIQYTLFSVQYLTIQ